MARGYVTTGHLAAALERIAVNQAARDKLHAQAVERAVADKRPAGAQPVRKEGGP